MVSDVEMDDVITREAVAATLTRARVVIVTTGIEVVKAGIATRVVLAPRVAMKGAVTKAADAMSVAMAAARAATAPGAAAVARVARIMVGRSKGLAAIRMVGATRLAATRTGDRINRVRIRALAVRLGRI